jgi:hypothetical protein
MSSARGAGAAMSSARGAGAAMSSAEYCRSPAVATIRASLADGRDGESVRRLASLTARPPPKGAVLLAEVDGEPVAAVGIADGEAIADPERSTPQLLAQLRIQRLQVRLIGSIWGI